MNDIGGAALKFAFVTALYAVVIALLGVWRGRPEMIRSAERATYGVFGLVTIAMVAMLYALLAHDFRLVCGQCLQSRHANILCDCGIVGRARGVYAALALAPGDV